MLSRFFLDFSVGVRTSVKGLSQISSFFLLRASKFSVLKLTEIVTFWVYNIIPFGFSFVLALSGNHFNF